MKCWLRWDVTTVINLKSYLPEGIRLADSEFNGKITVTIPIEEEQKKELQLAENHFQIINVPEGYTAQIDEESDLTLEVAGLQADVSELLAGEIVGTIDFGAYMEQKNISLLEPGTYTVAAAFDFGDNITIVEPVRVRLIIEKVGD